jgi:hypothetical protein
MKINIEIAEVNVNFYVDDDEYALTNVKSLRDETDTEQGNHDSETQEIIERGKEIIIDEAIEDIVDTLSKIIPDSVAYKAGKETETSDK